MKTTILPAGTLWPLAFLLTLLGVLVLFCLTLSVIVPVTVCDWAVSLIGFAVRSVARILGR